MNTFNYYKQGAWLYKGFIEKSSTVLPAIELIDSIILKIEKDFCKQDKKEMLMVRHLS